jgi:ethanolamine utilization protein EutM
MTIQAIGLLETCGLVALVEGTDAMLKAANVQLAGPLRKVDAGLVSAVVMGDVAAVRAAVDAGAAAARAMGGQVISAHVIARPHDEVGQVLPVKP